MHQDDRKEILELYKDFRVADVRDGLDWNNMHHYGSVHHSIRPLFRTRAVGIARTSRYVPYEGPIPKMTPDEYTDWVKWYYKEVSKNPAFNETQFGDFMVVDTSGVDVGIIGSENSLFMYRNGCAGILTNGSGIRDTDELIIQKIPVWSLFYSQKMNQGRIRFEANDVPVNVGGVTINTGDVIVADGDGVVVVPRNLAYDVAKYAQKEQVKDKAMRRNHYEKMGWDLDDSVK